MCCLLVPLARPQVLGHFGPGTDAGRSCLQAFASELLVSEQTAGVCCDILSSLSSRPEILAARRGRDFVEEMAERFVESLFHPTQEVEERSTLHFMLQSKTMMTLLRVLTSSLPSEELLEKACSGVVLKNARLCSCKSARSQTHFLHDYEMLTALPTHTPDSIQKGW